MAKQFRKAKKRPSRERQNTVDEDKRDADLEELWEVLAERKSIVNWEVPWRNGVNVVELCLRLCRALAPGTTEDIDVIESLKRFVDHPHWSATQEAYWKMQEFLERLNATAHRAHEKVLLVGVRCAQLMICNSHGGGHVYNDLLKAIWHLVQNIDADKAMRAARCKDALGIDPTLDGGVDDRRRRAFFTAWDRGLLQVAYAVGS